MFRPRTSRLSSRLASTLLALALLFAWQTALEHPIEHVDHLGELVHLHERDSHTGDSGANLLCDALAALTACATPMPAVFAQLCSDHQSLRLPSTPARSAEPPPFRSHAPPVRV